MMASPVQLGTPPPDTISTQNAAQAQTQSSTNAQVAQNASSNSNRLEALLSQPATSLSDDGTSKRPRDYRLIHLLLTAKGVNAYQERVPLQLMDFAYRYTSSVLSDALHIQNEGYDQADNTTHSRGGRGAAARSAAQRAEEGDVSLAALRMSIQSRMSHQFQGQGAVPKEFLKQLADERNRISLNAQARDEKGAGMTVGGVKLPHERYCLTGVGWGLKTEWESEGEESMEDDEGVNGPTAADGDDVQMDEMEDGAEDDDDDPGQIEDIFGQQDGEKDGDEEMEDD